MRTYFLRTLKSCIRFFDGAIIILPFGSYGVPTNIDFFNLKF